MPVVEHLVCCHEPCMRVCWLGEELLPSVFYVLRQMRPSSTLKEEIVELFNLQLCVHHLKGQRHKTQVWLECCE